MNYIPSDWKKWIAENLLLQADPKDLVRILVQNNFSSEIADMEVQAAAAHPYVEAGRSLGRKLKKRDWVLDTYRILDAQSPNAATVERTGRLSREEFFEMYYSKNRPVIMKGALDHWKALTLWTPNYLKEHYGQHTVEIQANRQSDPQYELNTDRHKTLMGFAEYIDTITTAGVTNDYYMTANNANRNTQILQGLWSDIDLLPDYLAPQPNNSGFFWFGPAGTVTPVQHDLTNNFMAQVRGRKQIKLISPNFLPCIYNHRHCYSQVDLDKIDYDRYPLFRNVRVIDFVLEPGELFFLPVGWWHYVRGLDVTITMTFTNFLNHNDFSSSYQTYEEI